MEVGKCDNFLHLAAFPAGATPAGPVIGANLSGTALLLADNSLHSQTNSPDKLLFSVVARIR